VSAQSIYRSGERELSCTQAFDEVPATTLACLLERAERSVRGTEAAFSILGEDTSPGHHAVPIE
jgi:hypothetical protein